MFLLNNFFIKNFNRNSAMLKIFALKLVKIFHFLFESFQSQIGITSQIRRASLSVPTNIAEGCGRESHRELRRYLVIAIGSIVEVEYLLLFSFELNYTDEATYHSLNSQSISIKKKLTAYKNKLPRK